MGSYFFKDSSIGDLECEEDLNTVQYLAGKAKKIEFSVSSKDYEISYYTCEFFKYLFQKYKFTKNLEKIKIKINRLLSEQDTMIMFLTIQKYLNKLAFCKKFEMKNVELLKKDNFSVKIRLTDSLYRIKKLKHKKNLELENCDKFLNYFTIFCFTDSNYTSELISKLLLNENFLDNYDHLLTMNVEIYNYERYINYLNYFIEKNKTNNIKLPCMELNQNLMKFLVNLNTINLKFIDLSFYVYITDSSEFLKCIKYIAENLNFSTMDYIIRLYLFPIDIDTSELQIMYKKALTIFPSKKNSYYVLYYFNHKIIYANTNVLLKPQISDDHLDNLLLNQENRNTQRISTQLELIANIATDYQIIVLVKHMTKIIIKSENELTSYLYIIHSANQLLRKLKKYTITNKVISFLNIFHKNLKFNSNNSKTTKNIVLKSYIQNQEEFRIPINRNPSSQKELHSDLVHVCFDQVFNLLRIQKSNKI